MTCATGIATLVRLFARRLGVVRLAALLLLQIVAQPAGAQWPPISVTAPAAGSVVTPGQPVTILWTGGDPAWTISVALIDVSLFQVVDVATPGVPNTGAATWTLPVTLPFGLRSCGRTFQFYVQNVPTTQWAYGPLFTTPPCPFSISSPSAGSVLVPGQPVTIRWSGGDPAWSVHVKLIEVSLNQVVAGVAANVPNDGLFTWTLPVTLPFGLQSCGRTVRFYIENVQQTSWIYGPQLSTAPCAPPNAPPTANAGPGQSIHAGATVILDGSGSFDDNTPSASLQFAWSFLSRPTGSAATLGYAGTAAPSFVADKAGTYTVRLVVTDEGGLASAPSDVVISSLNQAPTANAGSDRMVIVAQAVQLDGSASSDPDQDTLYYAWSVSGAPAGSAAALTGASTATPVFVPDLPGSYTITLQVNDAFGPGTADTVEVTGVTAASYAEQNTLVASQLNAGLGANQVTTAGNQVAFGNFLNEAAKALQQGDTAKAIDKLKQAIARTDGCERNAVADGNGPGRDWIIDCTAQAQMLVSLRAALGALAP
jgi:hypothetical protein